MSNRLYFFFAMMISAISSTCCGVNLQSDIDRATAIIRDFKGMPETSIPYEVLRDARGFVILSELKGGFIFSGSLGSGLVIAKLDKGWSAPSAIGTGGAGFGLQIGGEVTDLVLVLNSKAAVDAFAQGGSVSLGGNLSIAAGPVGRTARGAVTLPLAAVYSYSRSQGGFVGISVEGMVFVERAGDNAQFYGEQVTPEQLLYGQIPPPKSAGALYRELEQY